MRKNDAEKKRCFFTFTECTYAYCFFCSYLLLMDCNHRGGNMNMLPLNRNIHFDVDQFGVGVGVVDGVG